MCCGIVPARLSVYRAWAGRSRNRQGLSKISPGCGRKRRPITTVWIIPPFPLWEFDYPTGSIIQSERSQEIHGYAKVIPDVPASLIADGYVHPECLEDFRRMYDQLLAGAAKADGVFRVRSEGCTEYWFEHISYTNLFDEQGRPYRAIGMSEDVTRHYAAAPDFQREQAYRQVAGLNCYATAIINLSQQRVEEMLSQDPKEAETCDSVTQCFLRWAERVAEDEEIRRYFLRLSLLDIAEHLPWRPEDVSFEYLRQFTDGSRRWVRYEAHFQREPLRGDLMLYQYLKDIDEEKRRIDALTKAAETDAMTGFYNHNATMTHIEHYLQLEGAGGHHVLFMIDIDHFKDINDNLGHQVGDETITKIATAIRGLFRGTDILGRVGGDEFLVLMKNVDNRLLIRKKATELVDALQFVCSGAASTIQLSGSVGIGLYEGEHKTAEQLYAEADAALYRAKKAGKNRYALPDDAGSPAGGGAVDLTNTIQLRMLLEYMDGGVAVVEVNQGLHITYISPSFYKMMGRSQEQFNSARLDLLALVHPADRPSLEAALYRAAASGELIDQVYRVGDQDNAVSWRHLRAIRLPDSEKRAATADRLGNGYLRA